MGGRFAGEEDPAIRASHIADQLVVLVPENRGEFEEDFVENAHAGFADGLALASGQALGVKGDPPGLQDAKGHGDEYVMSMVAAIRTSTSAPEKSICFTFVHKEDLDGGKFVQNGTWAQSRQHRSQSCRRKLEGEFLQRVVLLVICVSDLYKEWLFMNRREALMAAAGSIAAVVAIPSVASADPAETEDDNPELAPIRALLDAYDSAFTNHDLAGVMATMSEKATMMGCGPGEIWSGPDELKAAHEHLFETFDIGQQNFEYEFSIGELSSDTAWMMTSGNVTGQRDGKDFTFPVNISLTAKKDGEKWLIAAMHFSTVTGDVEDDD